MIDAATMPPGDLPVVAGTRFINAATAVSH
jgi:hypothetical protein